MAFSLDRFRVGDIASVAAFEILETYQDNTGHYEEANYSYIPLPFDEKYVEVENRSVNELDRKQTIRVDFTIKEAIERLQEYPFLIYKPPDWSKRYMIEDGELELTVRRSKATESNFVGRVRYVVKKHPKFKQKVLELEAKLAERIEVTFSNSRSLFPDLSPRTIGRGRKQA